MRMDIGTYRAHASPWVLPQEQEALFVLFEELVINVGDKTHHVDRNEQRVKQHLH